MIRLDFGALRRLSNDPASKIRKASESPYYSQFSFSLANTIELSSNINEDEMALATMSIQNWVSKKEITTCKDPVSIGDIFLADLGNAYKPELAYPHPIIILEEIGGLVLVVPATSSSHSVTAAHHPVSNPKGNKFLRKVTQQEGFGIDCAVILSNVRTISKGRLLDKKGQMPDISNEMSVFQEIKQKCFNFCFPRQFIKLNKAQEEVIELKQQLGAKDEQIAKLERDNAAVSELNAKLLEQIQKYELDIGIDIN